MLRIIERNSGDEACVKNLSELKEDLIKCGHREYRLDILEPKAVLRSMENKKQKTMKSPKEMSTATTLVFKTKYFPEVKQLKAVVHKVKDDIKHLVGECRTIFALKKHESISQFVIKNRKLGTKVSTTTAIGPKLTQACYGPGCGTCPILAHFNDKFIVNGLELKLDRTLTCKNKCIIYIAQCITCCDRKGQLGKTLFEDTYFGQTVTKAHVRFNGHRKCFKIGNEAAIGKSALSQHCLEKHPNQLALTNFRVGIVKLCKAVDLDMEENRYVTKYRTDIYGINRIKVVR